jgi:hypothetical protein
MWGSMHALLAPRSASCAKNLYAYDTHLDFNLVFFIVPTFFLFPVSLICGAILEIFLKFGFDLVFSLEFHVRRRLFF